jgi:hypothetical protein
MFAFLLNATDYEANTPFHIAVESGYPSMVSSPLQTMSVLPSTNMDGLMTAVLAYSHLEPISW